MNMKPYHYLLITIGFAIASLILESFGYLLLNLGPISDYDYMSISGQIWMSILFLIVLIYPLAILWFAFPNKRPKFTWDHQSITFAGVILIGCLGILLSITTHPFSKYYLLYEYYTSDFIQPYATVVNSTRIYTLSAFVLIPLTPFVQELLFRKYLTGGLLGIISHKKAFFAQLLGFTVFQLLNAGSITETLVVGIMCGAIYIRTRNIYLSLTFNFAYSISVALIGIQKMDEFLYNNLFGIVYWGIIFVAGLLSAALIFGSLKFTKSIVPWKENG